MTRQKLKIKDVITVVLLALINVALFFASALLYDCVDAGILFTD